MKSCSRILALKYTMRMTTVAWQTRKFQVLRVMQSCRLLYGLPLISSTVRALRKMLRAYGLATNPFLQGTVLELGRGTWMFVNERTSSRFYFDAIATKPAKHRLLVLAVLDSVLGRGRGDAPDSAGRSKPDDTRLKLLIQLLNEQAMLLELEIPAMASIDRRSNAKTSKTCFMTKRS